MKKILFTLFLALTSLAANAQLEYVNGSFTQDNKDASEAGEDLGSRNLTSELIKDWPEDFDGNGKAALLRAVFTNVPDEDIRDKMTLSISSGLHVVRTEYVNTPQGLEMWTFVDPSGPNQVDLTYKQDGTLGNAIVRDVRFEAGKMYMLEINNKLRLAINVETLPAGIGVQIAGRYYGDTPVYIPDMTTGEKSIVLTVPADKNMDIDLYKLPSTIRVNQSSTNFKFDLRKKYEVRFTSRETGTLYINDEMVGQVPCTKKLYAGTYNIRATGANGVNLAFPLNVNANTNEVPLVFTPSLTISFAAQYDGRQVNGAHVYITDSKGMPVRNGLLNYFDTPASVLLPYDKYHINTTYTTDYGATVSKNTTLKVDQNTDPFSLTVLPIRTVHTSIFNRDFPRRSWGLSASYIQKWYTFDQNGRTQKCDWWGNDGHVDGVQFGIAYQPYFGYGLGLNTGFFGQYFWSSNETSESELKIEEWDIFVPMHLMFRLPIKDYDFHINTGVGFEYGVSLKGIYSGSESGSEKLEFDDDSPRAFNMYYEIGAGFRIKALQINFLYGMGLTKNKKFLTDEQGEYINAKPSKLAVTLGLMF